MKFFDNRFPHPKQTPNNHSQSDRIKLPEHNILNRKSVPAFYNECFSDPIIPIQFYTVTLGFISGNFKISFLSGGHLASDFVPGEKRVLIDS